MSPCRTENKFCQRADELVHESMANMQGTPFTNCGLNRTPTLKQHTWDQSSKFCRRQGSKEKYVCIFIIPKTARNPNNSARGSGPHHSPDYMEQQRKTKRSAAADRDRRLPYQASYYFNPQFQDLIPVGQVPPAVLWQPRCMQALTSLVCKNTALSPPLQ